MTKCLQNINNYRKEKDAPPFRFSDDIANDVIPP